MVYRKRADIINPKPRLQITSETGNVYYVYDTRVIDRFVKENPNLKVEGDYKPINNSKTNTKGTSNERIDKKQTLTIKEPLTIERKKPIILGVERNHLGDPILIFQPVEAI